MFEDIYNFFADVFGTSEPLMIYSNIISIIAIIAMVLYWYFYIYTRGNIFLLRKIENMYFQIDRIRIKKDAKTAKKGKKTYNIKPSFFDGNKPNAYIDADTGDILTFYEYKSKLSPSALDIFVADNILANLARGLSQYMGMSLIILVIIFIAGLALGLVAYPYLPAPNGV